MTHICISKLTIIGSDNGLSPGRRQAIIWTNAGILLIWTLGTNFSEILIEIYTFSLKKMHLKMSSGKWRPFCLGLNVLTSLSLATLYKDVSVQDCGNSNVVAMDTCAGSSLCFRLCLTHGGRDKMAAILQTIFSNVYLEWKCLNFG